MVGIDIKVFDEQTNIHIKSIIGSFEVICNHRENNNRTGVLEVVSDNGRYFAKVYSRISHYHRELYAYKNWTADIEPFAPVLVAPFKTSSQFGIIITPIVGKTVNESQIQDEDILTQIYYDAGQLFRKMQGTRQGSFFGFIKEDGTPADEHSRISPIEYVSDCIERLFKSLCDKRQLNASYAPVVLWAIKNCCIFADEVPKVTNWDLSPRNWMVDSNGKFTGFIDFENTSWGITHDSFSAITQRYAYDKPYLKSAFFEGYGLSPNEEANKKMKVLDIKAALGIISSGHIDGNQRWIECGNNALLSHMKTI